MTKKLIVSSVLIIFFAFLGINYIREQFLPVSLDSKSIDFLIPKGASVSTIGNNLEKKGLIKNSIGFKFYVQVTNSQNKIQAGEFQLSPSLSLIQVVDQLKKGPKEIWVTIPEGLRKEEIAAKFAVTLEKDQIFIDEFLDLTVDSEGYLFPETYLFPKTATAAQVVNKLISTFNLKIEKVTYQQLIMASMLERETFSDSEKPIVAGVLYKRIENGWPLQVDATLQYAKDSAKYKVQSAENKYWDPIYSLDKEIDSAFNTYKNLGLPPSPIASPGLSSIQAAINPESSDYWYYIHGKIHFAKTLEEHNQNIDKYLK